MKKLINNIVHEYYENIVNLFNNYFVDIGKNICELSSGNIYNHLDYKEHINQPNSFSSDLFIISSSIKKTSSTGPSGKNKIVYKFISQPQQHLRQGKLKNTTQGSNQRLTAPLNPFNVPVSIQCREGDSTHKSGPERNTLQIGTFRSIP